MRRFRLIRNEDVSGISGTGLVAEGVQFDSGKAVLSWCSEYGTVAVFDSVDDVVAIHGHEGRTRLEWIDLAETQPEADHDPAAEATPGEPIAEGQSPGARAPRVARWVLEDLAGRRRAGAPDSELISLLAQPDRGGLDASVAAEVVASLDAYLADLA